MKRVLLLIVSAVALAADQVLGLSPAGSPEVMAAGIGGLGFGLFAAEGGEPTAGGGGQTIGDKLAAAEAEITRLQARNAELESGGAGAAELEKLRADIEERDKQITQAKADLEKAKADLEKANADLAQAQEDLSKGKADLEQANAEVEKLRAEATSVDERAKELVAALGYPESKLPPAGSDETAELPSSEAELEEAVAKLPTHHEKAELIRKYRAAQSAD